MLMLQIKAEKLHEKIALNVRTFLDKKCRKIKKGKPKQRTSKLQPSVDNDKIQLDNC